MGRVGGRGRASLLAAAVSVWLSACSGGEGAATGGSEAEALPLAPDPELARAIESHLEPLLDAHLFSGTVLVGGHDSLRYLGSWGMADEEAGEPIGPETRFVIASLTKGITAAAILVLRERGALALDDPLSRFEPGFPRAGEVTVRQLLLHRSGVDNPDYLDAFGTSVDLAGLIARIAARPYLFDPGTSGRYSNAGYALLARVIERASGTAYADFVRANVYEPLGMVSSGDIAANPTPNNQKIGLWVIATGAFRVAEWTTGSGLL